MTHIAELDQKIAEKREELARVTGRPTEVYARIVGYYRSLNNWNRGKRAEFGERVTYDVSASLTQNAPSTLSGRICAARRYIFFYRATCPACPAMKSAIAATPIEGTAIDVDSEEGFALAAEYAILTTPQVIFLGSDGSEIARSNDPVEVRDALAAESLAG